MQYAVTVDVVKTVFSAFGTVQKIAIFDKGGGGTQALIQYPDVTTAAVAKDALEGHCIYDGGYCKLHLSYSRHTDLSVKAYSDKSRDYTVPESGFLAMQEASGVQPAATVWQNPQAAPGFPGGEYTAGGGVQAQAPVGPASSWEPNMQAGRPTFVSVPSTFPGQTYASSSIPAYATTSIHAGSSTLYQTSQINPSVPPMRVTQPMHPQHVRHGGMSPPGQPPYFS
ncbi:unnamed protein product [Ilex paraguariensis]|uniref:PTBP1-like RNA recognition motif 2 domain-containing protein n=1 Tax=Ilex paraguariensis TaxID=185542 RepID=A0ABC8UYC8_9AQUA